MRRIIPSSCILFLLLMACGGANHWEGLSETLSMSGSGASSLALTEVYVCGATGDDFTGDGSQAAPFQTIQRGINEAVILGAGEVRVAAWTYGESLHLIEGISLYGGYESTSWTRDTIANPTTIDGSPTSAIIADIADSPVTTATVVDGFILQTTGVGASAVDIVNTSPTISHNTITGMLYGIRCDGSSAVISDNTLEPGSVQAAILCDNGSSDTIENNTINTNNSGIRCNALFSGAISGNTITVNNRGIDCTTAGGAIEGNTISSTIGIYLQTNSTSTISNGNTINATNYGIMCVDSAGTIEGNTISAGVWGINCATNSTTMIRDNTVTSPNVGIRNDNSQTIICYNTVECTGNNSYAMSLQNDNAVEYPVVYGNLITGGGAPGITTRGIGVFSSYSRIYNNVIVGGTADANNTSGIFCTSVSEPWIFNNTIDGGHAVNAANSYGIYINTNATPRICNNIIYISGVTTIEGFGIYEVDDTCNPVELRNNNIFNCVNGLYHDTSPGMPDNLMMDFQLNDESLTNQGGAGTSDGNVVELISLDAQGRRPGAAVWPMAVIGDGLNGNLEGWGFVLDRDGALRTTAGVPPLSWSMGAYEYDSL